MKHMNQRQSVIRSWRTTALSAAILISLTAISSPVNSATDGKKIGDLEIYQAAKGGRITIMMMLDTSGSMDVEVDPPACDLPKGVTSQGVFKESPTTENPYERKYCKTGGTTKYFYRKNSGGKWFRCGSPNVGSDKMNVSSCKYGPITAPSTTGYLFKKGGRGTGGKNTLYYYKTGTEGKSYDRLTRLKDAIFFLMNDDQLDSEKIAIGIGQYSTQSDSDNKLQSADGMSGKILVPAALLTETQRKLIKKEVAKLKGNGGTPTANAYAEVGAYMLGTNTPSSNSYSGFNNSIKSSKKDNKYDSPLTSNSTCDGQGIYFLTDGQPNSAPSPLALMKSALGPKGSIFNLTSSNQLPQGSSSNWYGFDYGYLYDNGMPEVGAFAKALRSATLNPLGENKNILTAVVGFGSNFEVDRVADAVLDDVNKRVIRKLSYLDSKGITRTSEFYNCSNITDLDARNACNWGAKSHKELPTTVGGFGEGGFYAASSTDEVIESITTFVNDLDQTLPSAPAGTITIPSDPYRASNQLPYAYLPMLAPDVGSSASIWKGNLKKYNLNQGTLFGDNGKLYKNVAGDLSSTTRDIWQASDFKNSKDIVANNDISAGGFYAQLKIPKIELNSVRKLYVEDYADADVNPKTPILRELSVDTNGKPVGFNLLQDTDTYTELNKLRLLSFLGFKEAIYDSEQIDFMSDDDVKVSELTLIKPDEEIRVLGGVVHSTPTAISYNATLDDSGQITNTRDDYVLFGSMDGALHIADTKKGKEKVAIIPKVMLTNQPEALVENSSREDNKTGSPYFGVDAPWLVTTDYKYDLENKKVIGKNLFAYGGLRMGGEAFYGIDISKVNNLTDSAPKMLFTITKDGLSSVTVGASANTGFERLGQIWNKPTAAKIRINKDDVNPTDVLIFGGGYDMAYENDGYVATSDTPAKGNAIYMVDAKSGKLLWSTSGLIQEGKDVSMFHSIVGEITVLDRDNDGLTDHIYAADLGGQVFRIDLQNARTDKFGFAEVAKFSAKPPIRILDASAKVSEAKYAYRFYERPVVSFYRRESGPDNGKLFALVNVTSGNRSSPLSELRMDNKYANRVYGIIDSDVTRSDLYTSTTRKIENLTENNLVNLATTLGNTPNKEKKDTTKNLMITGGSQGWYYPLVRFDGKNGEKHIKGMGDSAVINSLLYTTVYNPLKQYGSPDKCSAKIVGGSERQMYCLPYGICSEETSINGTGGFIPAGQGIQELALGAFNKDNTNLKVLIGTTTLAERIKADNRVDFNGGGDGSGSEYIFSERYTFQPKAWYERSQ